MLSSVEVRTAAGTLLTLSLEDVSDGVILADIEGLDPVKAIISSSSFATLDGVQYQSSRREARNLIFKLDLEPDYSLDTVQDIRFRLYEFFMPKLPVSMKFIDSGDLIVDIDGRVESCGAPPFTKEPKMNISVICPLPDFIDLTPVELTGDTVDDTTETLIHYTGSVPSGMIFTLNVDRTIDDLTLFHRAPDNTIRTFELSVSMIADDVLTINTVPGSKAVTLTRGGTVSSVIYGKSDESSWFSLERGDNYIRAFAEGDPIPWEISYLNRYDGL